MSVTIYTDGCSLGNPGPGGYGAVLMHGKHQKEISKGFTCTTNNRMELLAVIEALEMLKTNDLEVHVYSDSKYVVDAIEKKWLFGWQKKNFKKVKNVDLWQRFSKIYTKHKVKFHWVKGHAGHEYNERCDQLANEAAIKPGLLVDHGYLANKT